jgi:hypothetical protein
LKHSNVFYTLNAQDEYTPRKNATGIRNSLGIDIFQYNQTVYEGRTGVRVCPLYDLDSFLKKRIVSKENYEALLKPVIEKYGLSPRYAQPEVKKEQLFPRDENRKLAPFIEEERKARWKTRRTEQESEETGRDKYRDWEMPPPGETPDSEESEELEFE